MTQAGSIRRWLAGFGAFWWDFIVGDDWRIAAGIIAALGLTAALAHNGVTAWWVMPVSVAVMLGVSLRHAVGRRPRG